jgi:transcriptional regulator with XRE-family HTH domain
MHFGTYLKICRQNINLTQEELATKLYIFDDTFAGVDTNTISRWERNVISPTYTKQIQIIKFFQQYSKHILPCMHQIKDINSLLCKSGVKYLLGKSQEHIQKMPQDVFRLEDIQINHIRSSQDISKILKMPHYIFHNLTNNYFDISIQQFENWAIHPANLFLVATIYDNFYGAFFILKLKDDIYDKIMTFDMNPKDIQDSDFADYNQSGSHLLLSFYAYNQSVAQMLFMRYYAHLILNQDYISEIGTTPLLQGAIKLIEKMHIKPLSHHDKLRAYSSPLQDILLNEDTLKMIFPKKCDE